MRRKAGSAAEALRHVRLLADAPWAAGPPDDGLLARRAEPEVRPARSASARLANQPAGARDAATRDRAGHSRSWPREWEERRARRTEIGEHAFWRGSLWGRTVALQGDSSFTKYDLFEVAPSAAPLLGHVPGQRLLRQRREPQLLVALRLDGPADERGRLQAAAGHRLRSSIPGSGGPRTPPTRRFASRSSRTTTPGATPTAGSSTRTCSRCTTGAAIRSRPRARSITSARARDDPLRDLQPPGAERGALPVRGVLRALHAARTLPALPWVDPFENATYVRNGFCEDFLVPPVQGGAVRRYLRGWSGSADAVITTDGGDEGDEPLEDRASGVGGRRRLERRLRHRRRTGSRSRPASAIA